MLQSTEAIQPIFPFHHHKPQLGKPLRHSTPDQLGNGVHGARFLPSTASPWDSMWGAWPRKRLSTLLVKRARGSTT